MPIIHGGGQQFHLQHSEEEKLNQFQTVTSFPDEDLPLIVKLLQNHSWNLEPALSRYFDGDWKENLLTPPVPARGEIPSLSSNSQAAGTNEMLPFLATERSYVPSLPVVSVLPQDYKEKFQRLGLQPTRSVFDSNPLMFIVMLLPNMLVKLGTEILSFLWHLLSFGFKDQAIDSGQKVVQFPSRPQNSNRSVADDITAVLGDESTELLELQSEQSFNELLGECESKFKFMLIVFLGNLVGETTDLNSQRFLKHILAEKSTLAMLKEHKEDLTLYIGYTQETDSWCVGKHLGTRYTPECYLVANVLNSTGSMNGTLQMSVIGNIRITSLKKFQRSLRMYIDRYTPELVVSRTEKEEIELARKLKEMQDQAFEESLRQDQLKEERRRQKQEEEEQAKLQQERGEYLEKLQNTLYNLYWLESALDIVDEGTPHEDGVQLSVLQIRTSGGKRMVKKFPGSTTLQQIYRDIGSHLYLEELSTDQGKMMDRIDTKIKTIAADISLLCFKEDQLMDLSSIEDTKVFVKQEFTKWNGVATSENVKVHGFIKFELVSAFPRYKIPLDTSLRIKDISQIWPNGSLLVEYLDDDELIETTA